MACAALIALVGPVALAASETLTDPQAALGRLQSGEGGTLALEFDGLLKLSESFLVTTNTTVDATGHSVILDGGSLVRHFVVTNGATLRLINLTLANGRAMGADGLTHQPGGWAAGGSIYNSGGALELTQCTFTNNQAIGANGGPSEPNSPAVPDAGMRGGSAYGGAVYSADGPLDIEGCVFVNNSASGGLGAVSGSGYTGGGGDSFGGALYSTNAPSMVAAASFTNNLAKAGEMSAGRALEGGGGAYGGALAIEGGVFTLTNSVLSGNQALGASKVGSDPSRETGIAKGGGVYLGSGPLKMHNSMLEKNVAAGGLGTDRGGKDIIFGDGKGGAVWNGGALDIRNSALVSNQASGGDLPPDCCSPFIGRAGAGEGGAVANQGILTLVNATFADNRAIGGRAVAVGAFTGSAYGGAVSVSAGAASFLNVTLASNRTETVNVRKGFGSSVSIAAGTAACTNTIFFSLPGQTNVSGAILDGGHNISSDDSARFTLLSSRSNVDPLLGALGDHGGLTPSIALLAASPAIDQGDDSAAPATDQRGSPRPMGDASDIGAFELAPQLSLARSVAGGVLLKYIFRASQTNQISVSTNLLDWASRAVVVADQDGLTEYQDTTELSFGFYRVQTSSQQ